MSLTSWSDRCWDATSLWPNDTTWLSVAPWA
jgi:hypothetical protein